MQVDITQIDDAHYLVARFYGATWAYWMSASDADTLDLDNQATVLEWIADQHVSSASAEELADVLGL